MQFCGVLPWDLNATKNFASCNGGMTTALNEVDVRFIALLCPFDRTQGPVCGGKAGQVT